MLEEFEQDKEWDAESTISLPRKSRQSMRQEISSQLFLTKVFMRLLVLLTDTWADVARPDRADTSALKKAA